MVFRDRKKASNEGPLSHVSRIVSKWLGQAEANQCARTVSESQAIDACELENRILYSGSPLPVDMMLVDAPMEVDALADVAVDNQTAEGNPFEMQLDTFDISNLVDPIASSDATLSSIVDAPGGVDELVFIDSGIENYETMLADLHAQFGESASSEIIILQPGEGVNQITETLSQHRDLRAIHLVSHGSGDGVELGGMSLNTSSLPSYAGEIASWQAALNEDADILFYGCDLAQSSEGSEFLEMMSALTTADVAGSDDLTGHASLAGDWDLEFVTGDLETELIFSAEFRDTWVHTLVDPALADGGTISPLDATGEGTSLYTNELWMTLQQKGNSGERLHGEQVLQFGGAGLSLGDQGADATISKLFGLDAGNNIDGLHYVTQDTQVKIGGTTFLLEVGDVLLSTQSDVLFNESIPGAGDALSFAADDIFMMKPTVDGNYVTDTTKLSMLLDFSTLEAGMASTLGSFTLVENSFSFGGIEIEAGEILFAEVSGAQKNDVHLLHSGDCAQNGAVSRLIDGQALGWQTVIQGMDVIEKTITVGGQLLSQGTIVFTNPTADAGSPVVPGAWSCGDVVAFDISQTELNGGTQFQDQLVLFDSSEMGFTCNHAFFALTIVGEEVESAFASNQLIVVEGETVTLDDSYLNYNGPSPSADQIEYVVSNVTGGYFALSSNVSAAIETFNQAQINDGLIVFVDDGDEMAPTYEVGVTTAGGSVMELEPGTVLFTQVNDAPVINLQKSEFTVQQNSAPADLIGISIADVDTEATNHAVTLTVENGTIALVGDAELVVVGNQSSQVTLTGDLASINQALASLKYTVETGAGTDTLTINVSDHADALATSLSHELSANIEVVAEADNGPTDYFTGGEFNIALENRVTKIELHGLFECAGTAETHPDPTFTISDVSNPELFGAVLITVDDMIKVSAELEQVGSSTITVRATGSDGAYSEAMFTVNVDTSSDEMTSKRERRSLLSQLRVLERSADVYEGADSGVTVIRLEACSDLSIVSIQEEPSTELETEPDPDSEPEQMEIPDAEEMKETENEKVVPDETLAETGTISAIVVNDTSQSTSPGSQPIFEGAAFENNGDVFEIDFKSRNSVRFQEAGSSSSYFAYQVQVLTSNLTNLQDNPFTVVMESANPFAFASLNEYSNGIDEAVDNYGVVLTGSLISLSGVSIGVVSWVARNSALVTSLMASIPTWQLIDPLVVLGNVEDLDSGESVVDIITAGENVNKS